MPLSLKWHLGNLWSRKLPCTVNVSVQPPGGRQMFPRCHFKDIGQSYFFLKNKLFEKTSCCSAKSVWSLYLGFVMFLSAFTHTSPLKNFKETWNHLILVTNERIKRKFWCWMKIGPTFSLGSVAKLFVYSLPTWKWCVQGKRWGRVDIEPSTLLPVHLVSDWVLSRPSLISAKWNN